MITDIFIILIFLALLYLSVLSTIVWLRLKVFLTWNTRYQGIEYEKAVTTPKIEKKFLPPKKTEQKGRAIKEVADLVDLADLDIETGMKAVEALGEGDGSR